MKEIIDVSYKDKLLAIKGRSLTWGDVGRLIGFCESTMRVYNSKPERMGPEAKRLIDLTYQQMETQCNAQS